MPDNQPTTNQLTKQVSEQYALHGWLVRSTKNALTCNSLACSLSWSEPLRQSRLGGGGSTEVGLDPTAAVDDADAAVMADAVAATAAAAAAAAARTGADPEKRTDELDGADVAAVATVASRLTEMGPDEFVERGLMGLELPPAAARAWRDSSVTG